MMDRPIERKRSHKKLYFTGAVVAGLLALGIWVMTGSSARRVTADALLVKPVQSGPFSVYLMGNGTVVPRDMDYVMPKASGELIAVHVASGDQVTRGQVLFEVENEELVLEFGNQEIALAEAKAALAARQFELETQKLQLQMAMLQAQSAFNVQNEEYLANKTLMDKPNPPISRLNFRQSEIRAEQLKKVYELEQTRLANFEQSMESQLNQFVARVNLAEHQHRRMQARVDDLTLRARRDGIIQDVDLKPGQRVEVGTVVGLISNPDEVYVRLKVSAVHGHRLQSGQAAIITTRGVDRAGKVVRIDPNVKGTTIDVDIELTDDARLRSNMFVTGKVIVEELAEALFVEAPSNTIENGVSSFYLMGGNGSFLQMTKVETGLLSAGRVQIKQGLQAGDRIVVSDTGQFNGADRITLD